MAAKRGELPLLQESLLQRTLTLLALHADVSPHVERSPRHPATVRRAHELLVATPDGRLGIAALVAVVELLVDWHVAEGSTYRMPRPELSIGRRPRSRHNCNFPPSVDDDRIATGLCSRLELGRRWTKTPKRRKR